MFDGRRRWHPARRIYARSIRAREAEALRAIDVFPKSSFFTPIDYDPCNGSVTTCIGPLTTIAGG